MIDYITSKQSIILIWVWGGTWESIIDSECMILIISLGVCWVLFVIWMYFYVEKGGIF